LSQPARTATACCPNQEEHHRKKSFADEFKLFVKRYELQWHDD